MVGVNLLYASDLFWRAAMMRNCVMRVRHADLVIRASGGFSSEHKRADSSNVCLKCERLKIVHEFDVFGVEFRDADWHCRKFYMAVNTCLHFLDALLDFTHTIQVFTNTRLVASTEPVL